MNSPKRPNFISDTNSPTSERYPFLAQLLNRELNTDYTTEKDLTLEYVAELHQRVGFPERTFPVIHITGSKGKGSVAAMFASVLQTAGLCVGLYTSPHIISIEERIQVNGQFIPKIRLSEILNVRIRPVVEEMQAEGKSVSFFEALTIAAFLYFAEESCDFAVIEAGMGGRVDATNICAPCLTVITNVSLEHSAQLGKTVEEIAQEKAGIIKKNVPLIVGKMPREVIEHVFPVIHSVAQSKDAPVAWAGRHFPSETETAVQLGMSGRHQRENAAIVCKGAELLSEWVTLDNLREGLKNAHLPGRLELVNEKPAMILDVAHNPESIKATVNWCLDSFPNAPKTIVFACARDKNWKPMLETLFLMEAKHLILTEFPSGRAESCDTLAKYVREHTSSLVLQTNTIPDPKMAVIHAQKSLPSNALLLVTGSFFLLREVYGCWRKSQRS